MNQPVMQLHAAQPGATPFASGNIALRSKDYRKAIECYMQAPFEHELMARAVGLNAVLARRGRRRQQQDTGQPKVLVCGWELSGSESARVLELSDLYDGFGDVEIIGTIFAKKGEAELWSRLEDTRIPVSALRVHELGGFVEQAKAFVFDHPCDFVHVCRAKASSILLGLLFQIIWDARVFVDIHADELAELRQQKSTTIDGYLRKRDALPELDKLHGEDWTRLALGLATQFDFLTVPSDAFRKKYGGTIINADAKFRRGSISGLRKQFMLGLRRSGLASPDPLRLLEHLPGARRLHEFAALLDIHASRLAAPPAATAPRARVTVASRADALLLGASQLAAAAAAQLGASAEEEAVEPEWIRAGDMAAAGGDVPLLAFGDVPLGFVRREQLGTLRAAVSYLAMLPPAAEPRIRNVNGAAVLPAEDIANLPRAAGIGSLDSLPGVLGDVWFASDGTLRLRFDPREAQAAREPGVVRAYQREPGSGEIRCVLEVLVAGVSPVFCDIPLIDRFGPVFLAGTSPAGEVRATAVLPFPSLCRGGPHHAELSAIGSRPDAMANLLESSAALLDELLEAGPDAAALSVSRLCIDLQAATGAERIFGADVQAWLRGLLGVRDITWAGEAPQEGAAAWSHLTSALDAGAAGSPPEHAGAASREGGGWTLQLPADTLPSISVLVSRRLPPPGAEGGLVGAFVLADPLTGATRSIVTVPASHDDLLSVQPRLLPLSFPFLRGEGDARAFGGTAGVPLGVAHRQQMASERQAALLAPVTPELAGPLLRQPPDAKALEGATVSVLFAGALPDDAKFGAMVRSLAGQTSADALDFVLALDEDQAGRREAVQAILAEAFPERWQILDVPGSRPNARLNAAAAAAAGRYLLLVDGATLLHDLRTLETLLALAARERVATASCVLVREIAFKKGTEVRFLSGGFFPSHVSLLRPPHWVFGEPYTLAALPGGTYPVIANSFRLSLVAADAWKEVGGLDDSLNAHHRHDLDFCIRAQLAGYRHLCTAAVTASSIEDGAAGQYLDSHSMRGLPPQTWQALLSRVTLLSEAA